MAVDGDGQADPNAHGGVHKAAYAYSIENYEYWKRELGRDDFGYGQFGENFTVEGMLEDVVHLGDVFRVGGAMVQISEPRAPCAKRARTGQTLPSSFHSFEALTSRAATAAISAHEPLPTLMRGGNRHVSQRHSSPCRRPRG